MGVTGLWDLLSPAARRVNAETLRGRIVAVDTSIWLIQFIKAMRNENGNLLEGAHLVGFFRRICKLLYYGIRPVFVFDGKPPPLKRKTILQRRELYENHAAWLRRTTEKILLNKLKLRLLNTVRAKRMAEKHKPSTPSTSNVKKEENEQDETTQNVEQQVKHGTMQHVEQLIGYSNSPIISGHTDLDIQDDIFDMETPAVSDELYHISSPHESIVEHCNSRNANRLQFFRSIPRDISHSLLGRRRLDELNIDTTFLDEILKLPKGLSPLEQTRQSENGNARLDDVKEYCLDTTSSTSQFISIPLSSRIDPEVFRCLPPKEQYAILNDIRDVWFNETRNLTIQAKNNPELLSQIQIETFLRHVNTTKEINDVKKKMSNELHSLLLHESGTADSSTKSIFDDTEDLSPAYVPLGKNTTIQSKPLSSEITQSVFQLNPSGNVTPLVVEGDHGVSRAYKRKRYMKDEERYSRILKQQLGTTDISQCSTLDGISHILNNSSKAEHRWEFLKSNPESVWETLRQMRHEESLKEKNNESPTDTKSRDTVKAEDIFCLDITEDEIFSSNNETLDLKEPIPLHILTSRDDSPRREKKVDSSLINANNLLETSWETEDKKKTIKEINTSDGATAKLLHKRINLVKKHKVHTSLETQSCIAEETGALTEGSSEDWGEWRTAQISSVKSPLKCQSSLSDTFPLDHLSNNGIESQNGPTLSSEKSFASLSFPEECFEITTVDVEDSAITLPVIHSLEEQNFPKVVSCQKKPLTNELPVSEMTEMHNDSYLSTRTPKDNLLEKHSDDSNHHFIAHVNQGMDELKEKQPANISEDIATSDCGSACGIKQGSEGIRRHTLDFDLIDRKTTQLRQEAEALHEDFLSSKRDTEDVTPAMLEEIKQLLSLFGIPYVLAPAEAEAQCAVLSTLGLCDAVLSEDSDTFVFGARLVYRNFFDVHGSIEAYDMNIIEKELNITQENLILLALLLGCDYTVGISGVGIVNAVEIIRAFPSFQALSELRDWATNPQFLSDSGLSPDDTPEKKKYKEMHKNYRYQWVFPDIFPDPEVFQAFTLPCVDKSLEPFSWSAPCISDIERVLLESTYLRKDAILQTLQPVVDEIEKRKPSVLRQTHIKDFFASLESKEHVATFRSKRLKKLFPSCQNESSHVPNKRDTCTSDQPNNESKNRRTTQTGSSSSSTLYTTETHPVSTNGKTEKRKISKKSMTSKKKNPKKAWDDLDGILNDNASFS